MTSAPSGPFRRHAPAVLGSLALLGTFLWILRAGALPVVPRREDLARVEPWGVTWMILLLAFSTVLRLGRYAFLIAPIAVIPMRRVLSISSISLALLTLLPFRLGELARPAMLREKGKVSGWAVTGTVGAERIIDGIVLSGALLIGLALGEPHYPLPERIGDLPVPAALVPQAARVAVLIFGGAFLVMNAFYWWRGFARRITERALGLVSRHFASRVADAVERLTEGLRFLPDLKNAGLFLLATLVAMFAQIWGISLLSRAVGLPELSIAESTVVLGVLGLGFALPNAPGLFGSFQLALYAGLAVYIAPERVVREGSVFVFIFYVAYIAHVLLFALWGIFAESRTPAGRSATGEVAGPSRGE